MFCWFLFFIFFKIDYNNSKMARKECKLKTVHYKIYIYIYNYIIYIHVHVSLIKYSMHTHIRLCRLPAWTRRDKATTIEHCVVHITDNIRKSNGGTVQIYIVNISWIINLYPIYQFSALLVAQEWTFCTSSVILR